MNSQQQQSTDSDFRVNHRRALIDRFKLTYEDRHISIFECGLCGTALRFRPLVSIAQINSERADHVCRKVA